jgi:hypothetical protein
MLSMTNYSLIPHDSLARGLALVDLPSFSAAPQR